MKRINERKYRKKKNIHRERRVSREEKKILKISRKSLKNREQKTALHKYQKLIKSKLKKERDKNRDDSQPRQVPITLEMKRNPFQSIVTEENINEVKEDELFDEFCDFFNEKEKPKLLVTTGHKGFLQKRREKPSNEMLRIVKDVLNVVPNSFYFDRKDYTIKKIIEFAKQRKYTFIMVIGDKNGIPYNMILSHLPNGPTITFKISSYVHSKKIKDRAKFNEYFPELILNNFTTRLGLRVGRILTALFPISPEFVGRRVVTIHNQRDFIFFRHHRYEFENKEDCILQEIGPRFTLRVLSLQLGTFDPRFGEHEWFYQGGKMDVDKKDMYL